MIAKRARRYRVPPIVQTSSTECGACCALGILGAHGRAETFADARDEIDIGRDGASLGQMKRYLEKRGMEAKALKAKSAEALKQFTVPVIVMTGQGHYVVLERIVGARAFVMDPAVGRRVMATDDLVDSFSGHLLVAVPSPEFQRQRLSPFSHWRGAPLLPAGSAPRLILATFIALVMYAVTLSIPIFTSWTVDHAAEFGSEQVWLITIAAVVGAAAGQGLLSFFQTRVLATLTATIGFDLMENVFRRLLRLPYRYFATRQPGEIIFRLSTVTAVRETITQSLANGVLSLGSFIVIAGYLLVQNFFVGLTALLLIGLNYGVVYLNRRPAMEAIDSEMTYETATYSMHLDAVSSIPSIRLGGYESDFLASWADTYKSSMAAMKRRLIVESGRQGAVSSSLSSFGPLAVLVVGLGAYANGQATLGDAVGAQLISGSLFGLASMLLATYTDFSQSSRFLERINEIRLGEGEHPGKDHTDLESGRIVAKELAFRYTKDSPNVFEGVNFDIDPGTKVAIVGSSGAGKSTLARVLSTLYSPTAGVLRYGNVDLSEYRLSALRSEIGYVPQESHIHNRSLMENLTLGRKVLDREMTEVLVGLRLDELIAELPMGLETLVTETGANFSGGQRQRIVIARTLLQRPKILILDEATASLDSINEQLIYDYIRTLAITQVVISHRLATTSDSDQIIVLEHGNVVEHGRHSELMNNFGVYRDLYTTQAGLTEAAV